MGSIIKIIVELFVIYLVYKLVVDFIIPIYRTTKHMKGKMNQMQQNMNAQEKKRQQPASKVETKVKPPKEDYIDYEEVN